MGLLISRSLSEQLVNLEGLPSPDREKFRIGNTRRLNLAKVMETDPGPDDR